MDKYGKITTEKKEFPPDEPLFLLRAQDLFAATTLRYHANQLKDAGDEAGCESVREMVKAFEAWPKEMRKHPD